MKIRISMMDHGTAPWHGGSALLTLDRVIGPEATARLRQ
jgi:hypothetical protein